MAEAPAHPRLRWWARIAARMLMVGGTGYLAKYLLLAVFDPHATATPTDHPMLAATTRSGLLLGTFLIPLGCTAVMAVLLLHDRHVLVAIAGTVLGLAVVVLLTHLLDQAFGNLHGDPARLRTEGSLAVTGVVALLAGAGLHRSAQERTGATPDSTPPGAKVDMPP